MATTSVPSGFFTDGVTVAAAVGVGVGLAVAVGADVGVGVEDTASDVDVGTAVGLGVAVGAAVGVGALLVHDPTATSKARRHSVVIDFDTLFIDTSLGRQWLCCFAFVSLPS